MNQKILLETYFNTYNLIFTDIINNNLTFKFIKEYPQITTPEYKLLLYDYLKNLIIQNINNITIMQYNNIINLLEENDIIITDINNLVDIIKSDDFYYTDDVLNIIYPKKDYIYYSDYIKLKEYSDAKLPINSIQHFTNKLFEQNNDSYYYYFSFGTLKNIELINWHFSLKPYVEDIKNMVNNPSIKYIVLAGHSVGSIVIQHFSFIIINKFIIKIFNTFIITFFRSYIFGF